MAKICILSAVNLKHMSLISLYTSFLEEKGVPYDIVYMDKYGEEEQIGAEHIYRYVNIIDSTKPKLVKALRYSRFIGYAKKVLEHNAYDFIIVWNDVAILMFGRYLSRRWKGRYCLNIRDYCGEKNQLVFSIFKRAILSAAFTTISSEGFKSFLPKANYVLLHSFNETVLDGIERKPNPECDELPTRISFIGNVRFFDVNKELIDAFKNDQRYVLCYHGTNADVIEGYASRIGASNVECSGSFPVSMTAQFLREADVINNVFGNNTIGVRTLTSIRLYYAAYLHIPIMVSSNTYMSEIVERYGIGFVVDEVTDELPMKFAVWYQSLDRKAFEAGCEALLREAKEAKENFLKLAESFLV